MDPVTVASAVITLLSPYLVKAGEAVARKAGETAWEKAKQIHKAIRDRFRKEEDSYPSQALQQFEKQPDKRKGAIRDVLVEILEKDPDFAEMLSSLLKEADEAGAGSTFNVSIFGGKVGEIVSIDRLEGGLTIDKRSGS